MGSSSKIKSKGLLGLFQFLRKYRGFAVSGACVAGIGVVGAYLRKKRAQAVREASVVYITPKKTADKKISRPAVNAEFIKRIKHILKILFPRIACPESGYVLLVAGMMIARTYCDVWMIRNGTAIEKSIITGNLGLFKSELLRFISVFVPISMVNNLLKNGLHELALRFRSRLTNHLYKDYLKGFTYYKMSNLDNRISNADQLLTQDVEKFSNSLADLYSNIAKPLLDMFIFGLQLTNTIGAQGPVRMLLYLLFSGTILTRLRRPLGRFTVSEQQLEGEFRYVNSRLITNSEEIAFYGGNQREQMVVDSTFKRLETHIRKTIDFRFATGVVDTIIAKYWATVVGYMVVSRPFFDAANTRHDGMSHSEKMEDYYRSGRMLVSMAQAVGRLVLAGRELTRLAGFTARVTQLMTVLKDLGQGKYERTMVGGGGGGDGKDPAGSGKKMMPKPGDGQVIEVDRLIRFEQVPLVTPNGDILVEALSFEVKSGMNVLVCGPNGCGKSSLFRTLGELWPTFGGILHKPSKNKLFYVPQRPYMTLGSFRDQIIYPHTYEQFRASGLTEQDLAEYLREVQLDYLVERDGGWDAVKDWMDVLSGGEKQRVAMARLFYHKPQFAILDECTSAVSVDVEGAMYARCRELGISLFTVSHRKSLWKYHEYVLAFDGRGSYKFEEIDPSNTDVFGS